MKRVLSVIILCLCMLGMTSCSAAKHNEPVVTEKVPGFEPLTKITSGQPNVYLVVKVLESNYWQVIIDGVKDAAEEIGVNVYYSGTNNETDWRSQLLLINKVIDAKADGLILAPNDSITLTADIEKLHDQGVPIALVDTVVNGDVFDICYMTDNYQAGQAAAKEMLLQLFSAGHDQGSELEVGVVVGSSTSQTISERLAGFYQYWSENAPRKWTIIGDIKNCSGDVDYAATLAEQLIDENSNLVGLFGTNNGPTRALCSTVMRKERKDIMIVGFDYSDEMKAQIDSDEYAASTMLQRQYDMGYEAVMSIKDAMDGESIENKFIDTGVITVNRDTMSAPSVVEVLKRN